MKRILIVVVILMLGIVIGTCLAVVRARSVSPAPSWPPRIGQRYEVPGSYARTVAEVWMQGVGYRRDGERRIRWCESGTWKRWAGRKGER